MAMVEHAQARKLQIQAPVMAKAQEERPRPPVAKVKSPAPPPAFKPKTLPPVQPKAPLGKHIDVKL